MCTVHPMLLLVYIVLVCTVLGSTLVVMVGAWWAACAHHGGPLALGTHTTPHCHRPLAPSQWAAVSQSQHYLPP